MQTNQEPTLALLHATMTTKAAAKKNKKKAAKPVVAENQRPGSKAKGSSVSDTTTAPSVLSEEEQTARQITRLLKPVPEDRADAARLDELRRCFARLYQQDEDGQIFSHNASKKKQQLSITPAEQTWRNFLTKSHAKFRGQLAQRVARDGKRTAVRTFWGVVASSPRASLVAQKPESSTSPQTRHPLLDESLLLQWVQAMSRIPIWDQSIQHMVQAEFLEPFRDVQYYTMMDITVVAEQLYKEIQAAKEPNKEANDTTTTTTEDHERQAERLVQMLMMIPLASSQEQLDDMDAYLFQPPSPENVMANDNDNLKSTNVDDSSSDEDEDSSDDDSDDDEDSDNEAAAARFTGKGNKNDNEEEQYDASMYDSKKKKDARFPMQRLLCHRKQWSKAWMAILRLPCLPPQCLKRALQFLPTAVLPVVSRPLLFADFFMSAYTSHDDEENDKGDDDHDKADKQKTNQTSQKDNSNKGNTLSIKSSHHSSIIPLLALDGLFYLMTEHGLEYPNYYKQLYKIIRPIVFSVKSKTRFFQLLDKSISRNDLLPAHLVAAFCKRLMRCCLQGAPPAGILLALVLVSNWCRQHSEVMVLLHRDNNNVNSKVTDKYNATTDDPSQANALQSCLWELSALQNHYYPAVATLAQSVGTPEEAKLPKHELQDYLQLTYKTLIEQERKRQNKQSNNKNTNNNDDKDNKKRKSRTPLAFQPPTRGLFGSASEEGGSVLASILSLPPRKKAKTTQQASE